MKQKNKTLIFLGSIGFSLYLSGCASVEPIAENEAIGSQASIPSLNLYEGRTHSMVDIKTQEPRGWTVLDKTDELWRIRADRTDDRAGCIWYTSDDWFAPPPRWENCGSGEWASGSHENIKVTGSLWPLEAGAKAVYTSQPVSSKGEQGTPVKRRCNVAGPVSLATAQGDMDAMKVTCKQARHNGHTETRTWYWNQEHGEIRYRRSNTRDGLVDDSALSSLSDG